jgi:serine/threonine protein phosphatase PrpC
VAVVDESAATVTIAHVGDSRAYLYRLGVLEQLTTDHSLVGELVRSGRLTEDEAAVHPHRSVITRALGTDADVEVDTLTHEAVPGDVVLLCSDGLSAMVRDEEIARVLEASGGAPGEAAAALVAAANAAGGEDNVTVVLFELVDGDVEAPPTLVPGMEEEPDDETGPDGPTLEDVRKHGAGEGSRWPALLLLLVILAVAAFVLWWSLVR